VVDDAIVMIENIDRYIEQGLPPMARLFDSAMLPKFRMRCRTLITLAT